MGTREFPEWPLVGVGGVVIDQGRALLVRRAREPALGEWTIPGGLLEVGETLAAAVERELREETGLIVRVVELIEALERIFSDSEEITPGTNGARVRGPQEVINDPQLRMNEIVVPLEGAGAKLSSTISSPIQMHGISKVPAKRAPDLGQHNEEVLRGLGFSAAEIADLSSNGTMGRPTPQTASAAIKVKPEPVTANAAS